MPWDLWGYCWFSTAWAISLSWALGIIVLAYVDDFATITPASTSLAPIVALHQAFGLAVHETPGKIHHPERGAPCPLLGVRITVDTTRVVSANEPDRIAKLVTVCDTLATTATVPLAAFRTLIGKLCFAAAQTWGRSARAGLRALFRHARKDPVPVTDLLQVWLHYFALLLPTAPPRVLTVSEARLRCTLWVDGAWRADVGTIGAVLQTPVGVFCWGGTVPQAVADSWRAIGQTHLVYPAELYAVWVSLETFAGLIRGCALLIFEDNKGARHSLMSGSAANPAAALQIHHVWASLARSDILPWVARVPSACNPADAPSRLDFSLARKLRWTQVPPVHPPFAVAAQTATELAAQLHSTPVLRPRPLEA